MRTPTDPIRIELTPREAELYKLACSDDDVPGEAPGQAATQLWDLLQERQAISSIRLAYLLDPELNVGGRGKSRIDVFEGNGTRGRAILEHPHFVTYLRYLVEGPDLPPTTIAGFVRIVREDRGTSGEVMSQLQAYARAQTRKLGNDWDIAEEFFKLAIECGADRFATAIRRASMQAR